MSGISISALPITPERFAPFGDVIHASSDAKAAMNDAVEVLIQAESNRLGL